MANIITQKKPMIAILSLLLTMVCGTSINAAATPEAREIHWAAYPAKPWFWQETDNTYRGIFFDTLQCAFNEIGVQLKISLTPLSRMFSQVNNDYSDITFVMLTEDDLLNRNRTLRNVRPYEIYRDEIVLVTRKINSAPIGTQPKARMGGSNIPPDMKKLLQIDEDNYTAFSNEQAVLKALISRRIDAALGLKLNILYSAHDIGQERQIQFQPGHAEPFLFSLAFSNAYTDSNPEVIQKFDQLMSVYKENGTLERIHQWYSHHFNADRDYKNYPCENSTKKHPAHWQY